jgi:predicted nuclease of predicted toxin-antitoxin system
MKFLIDRCAGHRLALWLQGKGHDVFEAYSLGSDPGDLALLQLAVAQQRIVVTIDTAFGKLIFADAVPHCGLVRLPSVPADERIRLLEIVLTKHAQELASGAIITVRGNRIRIANPPAPGPTP